MEVEGGENFMQVFFATHQPFPMFFVWKKRVGFMCPQASPSSYCEEKERTKFSTK